MKKPRIDNGAAAAPHEPATRLGALPQHLAEIVLHFAIGQTTLNPGFRTFEPFQSFACVCKEWFALLDEAVSKRAMFCTFFEFHAPTRSRVLELRRKLVLRRAYTTRIVVNRAPHCGDLTEQFWVSLLSHAPRLEKLDMDSIRKYSLPAHRLADVVKAASTQCPRLTQLVFSPTIPLSQRHERDRFPVKNRMTVLVRALTDAMQRWSRHDGLRMLHLDMSRYLADFDHCRDYFDAIIEHSPKLAALDGAATSHQEDKIGEQWWVSLETWDKFCRECKDLETIHWMPVPFATAYFEAFGRYQHEQLYQLVFAAHEEWNWKGFLSAADPATLKLVETRGFREHAVNPEAALRGCPNLVHLEIHWFCHEEDAPMEIGSMDPEIFNDTFFEAAVANCKKLETVIVKFVGSTLPDTLMSLTDRSLSALATLPDLTYVLFSHANVQGDGIFELFAHHKACTRDRREFKFVFGDPLDGEGGPEAFYDVLNTFLQRLVGHEGPLPCLTRDVAVTLTNYNPTRADAAWSEEYLTEIRDLVAAAKVKYPSLLFRGSLTTKGTDNFDSIKEFKIATKRFSTDDMWATLTSEPEAPTIDGIFTNGSKTSNVRRFVHEHDDNFDDDDDFDDDDEDNDELDENDEDDEDSEDDDSDDDDGDEYESEDSEDSERRYPYPFGTGNEFEEDSVGYSDED